MRCYRFAGGDGPRDSTVHRRKLKKIKWRVVCPATGFSAQSAVEDSGMKDGTMPVPTEKRARNVSKAVRCSVSAFSDEKEKGCGPHDLQKAGIADNFPFPKKQSGTGEPKGDFMKKEITLSDESLTEEFMSLLSVGLIEALKRKIITPQRAEQWLFSPVLAYSLSSEKFGKDFKYAMEYASETEAAAHCNCFEESLDFNENLFFQVIQNGFKDSFEGEQFIDGLAD